MNKNTVMMKNIIALLLLFATAFGVLALGIGAASVDSNDKSKDAIEDLLEDFGGNTTPADTTTSKPPVTVTPPNNDGPVSAPQK